MKKLLAALAVVSTTVSANPIDSVSALLEGDPRAENPDGISLSVVGTQRGANENIFDFVVDFPALMGANHPNAKLLEFYFNVAPNDVAAWEVSGVTDGWNVFSPASVQGGGGNTGFLFELRDTMGPTPIPLDFVLTSLVGDITSDSFNLAPDWEGNPVLQEAQLGAHIGGLSVNGTTCPAGGCSDSGFATADWDTSQPPGPRVSADAPGMLALLSFGLVGLVLARRQRVG